MNASCSAATALVLIATTSKYDCDAEQLTQTFGPMKPDGKATVVLLRLFGFDSVASAGLPAREPSAPSMLAVATAATTVGGASPAFYAAGGAAAGEQLARRRAGPPSTATSHGHNHTRGPHKALRGCLPAQGVAAGAPSARASMHAQCLQGSSMTPHCARFCFVVWHCPSLHELHHPVEGGGRRRTKCLQRRPALGWVTPLCSPKTEACV